MISEGKIREYAFTIHSLLTISWGLVLLYLRSLMTNWFFEMIALTIAILLSEAALIVAGATYSVAAVLEGNKHRRQMVLYVLMGLTPILTSLILFCFPAITTNKLVLLAAMHAFLFGASAFVLASKSKHHPNRQHLLALSGTISILMSAAMALLAMREVEAREGTLILGMYICFVGARMLLLAWFARRQVTIAETWREAH